ncbi:hypothetical protein [Bradyrhizobium sp. Cp5.3]|uniref:hypothetical protein n=1 Tax=Bradyrhizobium sp. Cp5.3 TaxID=443598 RepID=UPI000485B3B2|nr:hypothetical protein [Bradyrhizobium sp. Cp5.3]
MLTDQHFFQQENSTSYASEQMSLQTSAEFVRSFDGQAHEAIDAMAAVVAEAQAGLRWMRVEPLALEEVREALVSIVDSGKRAAEIVLRLRGLVKEVPKPDGTTDR